MPSSPFVKTVKTAGGQCIPLINGIMKTENAQKEIVKSFTDLVNMAKELMDENQQPSVQQKLERLSPSTRDGERGGESRELYRVGAGESSASTTTDTNTRSAKPSTTKRTIAEIWGSKLVETPPNKFGIFCHVKPGDFKFVTWFMSILKFGLSQLLFEVF